MLGAPPVNWPRLALVAALLILAVLLQKAQNDSLGWSFDLGLTLLISAALFLNLLDLVFLEVLALLLFMWKPSFSLELILVALLPLGAYWGKRILSWDSWTQNLVFIFLGLSLFYLAQGPGAFLGNWLIMLNNFVGCLVFGSILFFGFQSLYLSRLD